MEGLSQKQIDRIERIRAQRASKAEFQDDWQRKKVSLVEARKPIEEEPASKKHYLNGNEENTLGRVWFFLNKEKARLNILNSINVPKEVEDRKNEFLGIIGELLKLFDIIFKKLKYSKKNIEKLKRRAVKSDPFDIKIDAYDKKLVGAHTIPFNLELWNEYANDLDNELSDYEDEIRGVGEDIL